MFPKSMIAGVLTLLLSPALQAADLLQAYEAAVQQDTELAIEKTRLKQTRSQIRQAESAILPSLTAGGSWSRKQAEESDANKSTGWNLEAQQALFNGQAWYARTAAQQSFAAAQARYRDSEQALLLRVAEAYFAVLQAENNLRTLQAEEKAIQRQLEQVREQHEVGLIAITDVLEAQATYDSVKAARIGAEGALMISYEALEQITNERYEKLAILDAGLPIQSPEPDSRQAWVELALANSLTLQQSDARLSAAEEVVKAREAGHWPQVQAYANYSDVLSSDISAQEGHNTELGIRASVELYGGGNTSAQIQESTYALEEAQFTKEQARRQLLQQTRSLFTRVNTDVLTVQARQQAIRSAESALEATRSGYEVGTRNIVDVLNAERALWAAERDYEIARYDYLVNQLRLKRAAGTLEKQDLQELNTWLQMSER